MSENLSGAAEKIVGGQRLSSEEALALFARDDCLAELLDSARLVRENMHGRKVHFVHSLNINPTNVCENRCELCAFWREPDSEDAYIKDLSEIRQDLENAASLSLTDLHVVGGITPELGLAYYEDLFRMCRDILPGALIQALTAVEVVYLAEKAGVSVEEALRRLKAAGLGAIPGGGAEILVDDVRSSICSHKITSADWLSVHEAAHLLGIPSNATMLFGHIEEPGHIVEHMEKLRDLQDRTGGFAAFIPLPFQPGGTKLDVDFAPSGHTIAKVAALARLYLDNIPHIRLLANYMDRNLLQALASCAADDIGGTSLDEKIAKAAGADGRDLFFSGKEMTDFITQAGLEPVLVNSRYEPVAGSDAPASEQASIIVPSVASVDRGQRLTAEQAVKMFDECSFTELGAMAAKARSERLPGNVITYVVDRNISLTNICESGCEFCAFYVDRGSEKAFTLTRDQVLEKVREAVDVGATQIMIQGGLNPDLDLAYYEDIFRAMKDMADVWIHSLTCTEIFYLAQQEGCAVEEVLKRLVDAGLDSLPGGGAEILVDRVRQTVSPKKIRAAQWLDVMETAQRMGLKSTATMVYGLGETTRERIEHLCKIRDLQDRTGGFTAFIPWSFQPGHTRLDYPESTGIDYLKVVAIARLVLDNVPHIQAGWVTEGVDLAQLALSFGADDFGGVLMEEQVIKATGVSRKVTESNVRRFISGMGMQPRRRNTMYELLDDPC